MSNALILYVIVINIATLILFAYDKYAAIHGKRRIEEVTLLSFSLFGGAMGAYLAMYSLRHKTRKKKFQIYIPLFLTIQFIFLFIINM